MKDLRGFIEGDRVIIERIYNKCIKENIKLTRYAKNNDPEVFERSIFSEIFKTIAQECYMESTTSFTKSFKDKNLNS